MDDQNRVFCPVCKISAISIPTSDDYSKLDCPQCGIFQISGTAHSMLTDFDPGENLLDTKAKVVSVGHWLRSAQRHRGEPNLTSDRLNELLQDDWLPGLQDQLNYLILFIGDKAGSAGTTVQFGEKEAQFATGCIEWEIIEAIIAELERLGMIKKIQQLSDGDQMVSFLTLTFAGWLEYEELKRAMPSRRKAFMAMPFNKPDLDDKWLPALRSAVEETGFKLDRVDDNPKPGLIDTHMRLQIQEARFLIVELTHSNLGAHWEAGYAEGLRKPVIYTFRKSDDEKPHFDVEHSLRVEWTEEDMDSALKTVKATIRNQFPDAIN